MKTENERFRTSKPTINFYGPDNRFFFGPNFRVAFRDGFRPEMGVHFRIYVCPKITSGSGFSQVVGGNKRCNKPKTAGNSVLLLAVPRYPPARASGITCLRDRTVMVSTTRALPLSSQLRLRHSPILTTTCLDEDEEEGSRRLGENLDRC